MAFAAHNWAVEAATSNAEATLVLPISVQELPNVLAVNGNHTMATLPGVAAGHDVSFGVFSAMNAAQIAYFEQQYGDVALFFGGAEVFAMTNHTGAAKLNRVQCHTTECSRQLVGHRWLNNQGVLEAAFPNTCNQNNGIMIRPELVIPCAKGILKVKQIRVLFHVELDPHLHRSDARLSDGSPDYGPLRDRSIDAMLHAWKSFERAKAEVLRLTQGATDIVHFQHHQSCPYPQQIDAANRLADAMLPLVHRKELRAIVVVFSPTSSKFLSDQLIKDLTEFAKFWGWARADQRRVITRCLRTSKYDIDQLHKDVDTNRDILYVCVVDESHWGTGDDGVSADLYVRKENKIVVDVSATPKAERDYADVTRIEMPDEYISLARLLRNRITFNERAVNVFGVAQEHAQWYHEGGAIQTRFIRVKRTEDAADLIKFLIDHDVPQVSIINMTGVRLELDFAGLREKCASQRLIVVICKRGGMGDRFPKETCVIDERLSPSRSPYTVIQRAGRACGYGMESHLLLDSSARDIIDDYIASYDDSGFTRSSASRNVLLKAQPQCGKTTTVLYGIQLLGVKLRGHLPKGDFPCLSAPPPVTSPGSGSAPPRNRGRSLLASWHAQYESKKSKDPHDCPICSKSLTNRSNCVRHINSVHFGEKNDGRIVTAERLLLNFPEGLVKL